jgi:hypothetical protein
VELLESCCVVQRSIEAGLMRPFSVMETRTSEVCAPFHAMTCRVITRCCLLQLAHMQATCDLLRQVSACLASLPCSCKCVRAQCYRLCTLVERLKAQLKDSAAGESDSKSGAASDSKALSASAAGLGGLGDEIAAAAASAAGGSAVSASARELVKVPSLNINLLSVLVASLAFDLEFVSGPLCACVPLCDAVVLTACLLNRPRRLCARSTAFWARATWWAWPSWTRSGDSFSRRGSGCGSKASSCSAKVGAVARLPAGCHNVG